MAHRAQQRTLAHRSNCSCRDGRNKRSTSRLAVRDRRGADHWRLCSLAPDPCCDQLGFERRHQDPLGGPIGDNPILTKIAAVAVMDKPGSMRVQGSTVRETGSIPPLSSYGTGRHHVGTPGDIISECPGDFVGIHTFAPRTGNFECQPRREWPRKAELRKIHPLILVLVSEQLVGFPRLPSLQLMALASPVEMIRVLARSARTAIVFRITLSRGRMTAAHREQVRMVSATT